MGLGKLVTVIALLNFDLAIIPAILAKFTKLVGPLTIGASMAGIRKLGTIVRTILLS